MQPVLLAPEKGIDDGRLHLPRLWAPTRLGLLFTAAVTLEDGSWVTFRSSANTEPVPPPYGLLPKLLVMLVAVTAVAFVAVRAVTLPLRRLASAADALGKDIASPPMDETGPTEVRAAARAFNTMQGRLTRYIQDRTRIFAAMSHDLKTPITRLRLRVEMLDDSRLRAKCIRDLNEMGSMVTATLDFMRGVGEHWEIQPVDIMALVESIQADAEEMERQVSVEGSALGPYRANAQALRRGIGNLVENALAYGKRARIRVVDGDTLRVVVSDDGPGIPEADLERVFEPFFRLDASRNRESGGTGLGLTIARGIARAHGGDLILRNRPDGGLSAEFTLPRPEIGHLVRAG